MCACEVVNEDVDVDVDVNEDEGARQGDKNSTKAATAALAVVAPAGMILGAGSGSVYGTRSTGARILQSTVVNVVGNSAHQEMPASVMLLIRLATPCVVLTSAEVGARPRSWRWLCHDVFLASMVVMSKVQGARCKVLQLCPVLPLHCTCE